MAQCADWDRFNTINRLRTFLETDCLTQYQVHRMNDRRVMCTAARELCMNARRMVIKPKIGWAVWVDPQTRKPVQPIAVEGAPDTEPESYPGLKAGVSSPRDEQFVFVLAAIDVLLYGIKI